MMSRKPKAVAPENLRPKAAIVLDHPPADEFEERHLSALARRLFANGAVHLTLVGADAIQPERWERIEPWGSWLARSEQTIGAGLKVRHFGAGEIGLTLLPDDSGRLLVMEAANRLYKENGDAPISVPELDRHIVSLGGPSPDLIIVTGGLSDLSGSFTWPAAYAELVFFEQAWTRLKAEDFDRALAEFARRNRRFGGSAAAGAR